MSHFPARAVWGDGSEQGRYAWQEPGSWEHLHPIKARAVQWLALFFGMTVEQYSFWEHPCILWRGVRRLKGGAE